MSESAAEFPAYTGGQQQFIEAVAATLENFLQERRAYLRSVSRDSAVLAEVIGTLASGGKRMRASLCYWGWRGAGGDADAAEVVHAGAALELFQSAALIHDDIIDRSDTRRGNPSVHRRFAALHSAQNWALDAERFGEAAAILAGDMCLSLSEEMFTQVGIAAAHGTAARSVFNRMRTEVMAGQYLDVLEEVAGPGKNPAEAVERARDIIRYKSAKYSTEHPLVLGGALAGADEDLLRQYSSFALPLGEAFQIRDDVLGVFGNPAQTGKPAGDDLREGKRTVLTGYTLNLASASNAAKLEAWLGDPELSEDQVAALRDLMENCGALAAAEKLIASLSGEAFAALGRLEVDDATKAALTELANAAIKRTA